jgi:hypothetical protein
MLKEDNRLRLSEEVQNKYAENRDSWDWKTGVTEEVQRRVVRGHGFVGEDENEGLQVLRSALFFFPGDEEVIQSAHYLKYNINASCPLSVNSPVPDVNLFQVSPSSTPVPTSLHQELNEEGHTVVLAGSHT